MVKTVDDIRTQLMREITEKQTALNNEQSALARNRETIKAQESLISGLAGEVRAMSRSLNDLNEIEEQDPPTSRAKGKTRSKT